LREFNQLYREYLEREGVRVAVSAKHSKHQKKPREGAARALIDRDAHYWSVIDNCGSHDAALE
jgi:hypothetical protein